MDPSPSLTSIPSSLSFAQGAATLKESRESILIVDDSRTVRSAFSLRLGDRFSCYEAQNVTEALDQLKRRSFDLVITDVIMPGLSGVELLRIVLDRYPDTVVVVVSGVDRPQRALEAVRMGAFDYLIKPCDDGVLEMTVERSLERRRLLREAAQYKADLEARNEELARGKAELERLQAQIVHSEKMASLGKMSAGVAHEINNPVGFVSGNLDLLGGYVNDLVRLISAYDQVELPPGSSVAVDAVKREIGFDRLTADVTATIADCQAGVGRVREIVQNLRTFSRLDEAELKLTDIHEGIESTIRLLSVYFSGGNISLVRDFGQVPPIQAYSAQLNQVWMNLLANAAQAIGSGRGEVRVSTRADQTHVTVSVTDSGNGIAKADLDKIFDPFFTTKPVGEGTGLGLSIAFGIVERHRGRIEVDSSPGAGTKFSVVLPRVTGHSL